MYEIMWENWHSQRGHIWQYNVSPTLCTLDNYGKNTDTQTQNIEYVLLVHSNQLHECAKILRYKYITHLGLLVTDYQDSSRYFRNQIANGCTMSCEDHYLCCGHDRAKNLCKIRLKG